MTDGGGGSKRNFQQFKQDDATQLPIRSPPARRTRLDVGDTAATSNQAQTDPVDMSFDDFVRYVSEPGTQTALRLAHRAEMAHVNDDESLPNAIALSAAWASDEAVDEAVPPAELWSEESEGLSSPSPDVERDISDLPRQEGALPSNAVDDAGRWPNSGGIFDWNSPTDQTIPGPLFNLMDLDEILSSPAHDTSPGADLAPPPEIDLASMPVSAVDLSSFPAFDPQYTPFPALDNLPGADLEPLPEIDLASMPVTGFDLSSFPAFDPQYTPFPDLDNLPGADLAPLPEIDLTGMPVTGFDPLSWPAFHPLEWPEAIQDQASQPSNDEPTQPAATDFDRHVQSTGTHRDNPETAQHDLEHRCLERMRDIAGFPPSTIPLPPNLTLEQICWDYPNHLKGETLRRFIDLGWTGRKIWNSMQETAKKSNSKDQGWSKMTKRMLNEKKRMSLENPTLTPSGHINPAPLNQTAGEVAGHLGLHFAANETVQAGAAGSSAAALTHISETTDPFQPSAEWVQESETRGGSEDAAEGLAASLKPIFESEVKHQAQTIARILLYRDDDWMLIPRQEQLSRIKELWMANAIVHETQFAQEHLIDNSDIPFGEYDHTGMLCRLRELLKRAVLASEPPPADMDTTELEDYRKKLSLHVLEMELAILRDWTKTWKERLDEIEYDFLCPNINDTDQASTREPDENNELFAGILPSHAATSERDDGQLDRSLMFQQPDLDEGSTSTTMPRAEGHVEDANSSEHPIAHLLTFINQSQAQVAEQSVGGTVNANKRRRGARLTRMFPNAPTTDVVLSEEDSADLDNILENFPEHLRLPDVMERFIRPVDTNTGGYPTKSMVEKLRNHHNAKHGSDLNDPGRDRALWLWVTAQKNTARKARKARQKGKGKAVEHQASTNRQEPGNIGYTLWSENDDRQDPKNLGYSFVSENDCSDALQTDSASNPFEVVAEQSTQQSGRDGQPPHPFADILDPSLFLE